MVSKGCFLGNRWQPQSGFRFPDKSQQESFAHHSDSARGAGFYCGHRARQHFRRLDAARVWGHPEVTIRRPAPRRFAGAHCKALLVVAAWQFRWQ